MDSINGNVYFINQVSGQYFVSYTDVIWTFCFVPLSFLYWIWFLIKSREKQGTAIKSYLFLRRSLLLPILASFKIKRNAEKSHLAQDSLNFQFTCGKREMCFQNKLGATIWRPVFLQLCAGWQDFSLRSSSELNVKIRWDESRLQSSALWLNNGFKVLVPLNLSLTLSLAEFTSANFIQKLSSSKEKFIILK